MTELITKIKDDTIIIIESFTENNSPMRKSMNAVRPLIKRVKMEQKFRQIAIDIKAKTSYPNNNGLASSTLELLKGVSLILDQDKKEAELNGATRSKHRGQNI